MRPMNIALLGSLAAFALAACQGQVPDAASSPQGTWKGQLITDDGVCPVYDQSVLKIRDHDIVFSPGSDAIVLKGHYSQGSTRFVARDTEAGVNHEPYHMLFRGYPVGMTIGGTYITPRCHAHVTLLRQATF
ncbi:hypothetical protein E3E12_06870 [Formicincola oecophyllae]|uniref:Lipoprotein n=1 Tax=Formicincola oecophyllae TaxID=2558361 RepID=A0A4Y6UBK0_9PROT|nr:hypothetical protein [Formicincola oecophyllae]QDH13948.1 hypothetical protein E3E12_06870 [Formicincola oecophyllae]